MSDEKALDVVPEEEIRDLGEDSEQETESVTSDTDRRPDDNDEESATSDEPKTSAQAEKDKEEATTSEEEPETEPKKKGIEKRIDELVTAREDAKRERDHWRELALAHENEAKTKGTDTVPETPATELPSEPEYDDFDTVNEYNKAFAKWLAESNKIELAAMKEKIKTELREEQQIAEVNAHIAAKLDAGRKKYKDFDNIALNDKPADDGGIPYSDTMAELVKESPMTADLGYYFGVNLDEAQRVAALPPSLCAKEIGKIEAALEQAFAETETSPEPPDKLPHKRITQAPVPIRTVGRGDVSRVIDEKLPIPEYAKRHNLPL